MSRLGENAFSYCQTDILTVVKSWYPFSPKGGDPISHRNNKNFGSFDTCSEEVNSIQTVYVNNVVRIWNTRSEQFCLFISFLFSLTQLTFFYRYFFLEYTFWGTLMNIPFDSKRHRFFVSRSKKDDEEERKKAKKYFLLNLWYFRQP